MTFTKAFLLAGLFGAPCLARAEVDDDPCASLDELDSGIISCGDNASVSRAARECSAAVAAGWREAAQELEVRLRDPSRQASQESAQARTFADLDATIRKMERELAIMEKSADLVASYPGLMIDYPDGTDDESSLSCFNEAFHDVENTVAGMDQQIDEAKAAHEKARELQATSGGRHEKLDRLAQRDAHGRAGEVPGGNSRNGASDVTGVRAESALATASGTQRVARPAESQNPGAQDRAVGDAGSSSGGGASASESGRSGVSQGMAAAGSAKTKASPVINPAYFALSLRPQPESVTASAAAKAAARGDPSGADLGAAARVSADLFRAQPAVDPARNPASEAARALLVASAGGPAGSTPGEFRSPEDLFSRVHARYLRCGLQP